jgi:hypothetical protein
MKYALYMCLVGKGLTNFIQIYCLLLFQQNNYKYGVLYKVMENNLQIGNYSAQSKLHGKNSPYLTFSYEGFQITKYIIPPSVDSIKANS